jgi:hypothetical protein
MKVDFDFGDLEHQWKARQFDLFPWLDGLFALLRSRESLVRETKKRLSTATPATMVQFLASDDPESARVAREVINEQAPGAILPLILYSLEKVRKEEYPRRVMESMLGFDPAVSMGYLLGYPYVRPLAQERVFAVIRELFPLRERFPGPDEGGRILKGFFQALGGDLKERMPSSGRLEKMEDFDSIKPDLSAMLLVFKGTWLDDYAPEVEAQMRRIGNDVIVSLHRLPFDHADADALFRQLSEIIPYMALMRLKADVRFLEKLSETLESSSLARDEREALRQKAETAVSVIEQPERPIREIIEHCEVAFLPD